MEMIKIQDRILTDSNRLDNSQKEAFLNFSRGCCQQLESKLTLAQMKSLTNGILTYWRECIGVDVEKFWAELRCNNIDFERRDELQFALSKGRFRRVDIGMAARKDWAFMKDLDTVKRRFSERELLLIEEIIEKDEITRLGILKKCLQKRKIPQSQILKFGECIAYFSYCDLFSKYFSREEVEELYKLR
ncbi:hypothetical protein [Dawidia soli]|uniref:Uncharacterized protein n=1 Tax=Dawidia soli TaxID=2782352 RepID=A0AAP2GER0_9BACT|nr:hypothetical protein [Dawidia soli]MBT1688579.1 hypothetical protein [Dawidia soli]